MKKKHFNIVSSLAAATCTLLGSTAAKADDGWKIDLAWLSYKEQDRVSASEPSTRLQKTFANDSKLNLNLVYDTLSGPSPSGAAPSNQQQTFTGPSGSGANVFVPAFTIPMDDHFEDKRTQFGASWDTPINRLLRYNIGFNFSSEQDYKSLGISTGISRDFNLKNTTFATGISFSRDTIDPEGGTPIPGTSILENNRANTFTGASGSSSGFNTTTGASGSSSGFNTTTGASGTMTGVGANNETEDDEDKHRLPAGIPNINQEPGEDAEVTISVPLKPEHKNVIDWFAGITQVIDPQTVMQFSLGLNYASGYLNDPYKLISFVDANTGAPISVVLDGLLHEKRPEKRLKTSLYWDTHYHFDWDDTLYVSYRYMFDDWGIRSHTIDFKYRLNMGEHFYLQPHARWYTQTAADFYHESLNYAEPAPKEFSADTRLAAFDATTFGAKIGIPINDKNEFGIRMERYQQLPKKAEDLIGMQNWLDTFPDLTANIIEVSWSFGF